MTTTRFYETQPGQRRICLNLNKKHTPSQKHRHKKSHSTEFVFLLFIIECIWNSRSHICCVYKWRLVCCTAHAYCLWIVWSSSNAKQVFERRRHININIFSTENSIGRNRDAKWNRPTWEHTATKSIDSLKQTQDTRHKGPSQVKMPIQTQTITEHKNWNAKHVKRARWTV